MIVSGSAFDRGLRISEDLTVGGAGTGTLDVGLTGAAAIGLAPTPFVLVPGKVKIYPGGVLRGNGTIIAPEVVLVGGTNEFSGGQVQPGNSAGKLTLQGNFTQELGSKLVVQQAASLLDSSMSST